MESVSIRRLVTVYQDGDTVQTTVKSDSEFSTFFFLIWKVRIAIVYTLLSFFRIWKVKGSSYTVTYLTSFGG